MKLLHYQLLWKIDRQFVLIMHKKFTLSTKNLYTKHQKIKKPKIW